MSLRPAERPPHPTRRYGPLSAWPGLNTRVFVNWGYCPAMKVIEYYLESWRRFRDLQGRTTRSAFWWPFLIHPIVFLVLGGIFAAILGLSTDQAGPEVVYAIAYVWVLITLGVRRLHDMGRKGTWLLLGFVPFGNLVLLYWLVQPSTSETSE